MASLIDKSICYPMQTTPPYRYQLHIERLFWVRPRQYFHFADLPPTARICFEMLAWRHVKEVHALFHKDPSPFVVGYFKNYPRYCDYVATYLKHAHFSPKRAGCDWVMRLQTTGEAIGVLNLYDLNREIWNANHRRCTIGFTFAAPFRGKGLGTEAVSHLLSLIMPLWGRDIVEADTHKDNYPSQKLLKKLGFRQGLVEDEALYEGYTEGDEDDDEFAFQETQYFFKVLTLK